MPGRSLRLFSPPFGPARRAVPVVVAVVYLALYVPLYRTFGNIAPELAMIPLLFASIVVGRWASAGYVGVLFGLTYFFRS